MYYSIVFNVYLYFLKTIYYCICSNLFVPYLTISLYIKLFEYIDILSVSFVLYHWKDNIAWLEYFLLATVFCIIWVFELIFKNVNFKSFGTKIFTCNIYFIAVRISCYIENICNPVYEINIAALWITCNIYIMTILSNLVCQHIYIIHINLTWLEPNAPNTLSTV